MLFSPLLIYFPRLFGDAETQPLLATILCATAFVFGRDRTRSWYCVLLIFLALVGSLALQWAISGFRVFSFSSFQLLLGPLFLFGIFAARPAPPCRWAIKIVAIMISVVVVIELLFPGLYEAMANVLLTRTNAAGSHRGIAVLTPEPTYAAVTLSYLLTLSLWSRQNERDHGIWPDAVFFAALCATLSTYAVLILAVIAFAWVIRSRGHALWGGIGIVVAASLCWWLFAESISGTRAFVAIQSLRNADGANLVAFAEADPSVGVRVFSTWASILTPWVQPSGFGLECHSLSRAVYELEIVEAYSNEVLGPMLNTSCLKPPAYFPALMLSLGMFAFAFALVLIACIAFRYRSTPTRKMWWMPFWLSMLMIFVQGQITNPISWFLLFIALTAMAAEPKSKTEDGK